MARLYNLVLVLKGDLLNKGLKIYFDYFKNIYFKNIYFKTKVDRSKLSDIANTVNNSDFDLSNNFQSFQSSRMLNKQLNEDASKLKYSLHKF